MKLTKVILLVGLGLLAAGVGPRAAEARDLVFGFTPVLGQSETSEEFAPLMNYLSGAIGQRVSLYVAKSYGDLRTQMEARAVDIGSFSPFAYVDAARGGKVRIIAQSLLDGSATYRGFIIARADSGLRSVRDLKGKRFAFVDPKSASGYVYPRAMLVGMGLAPDRYFKSTFFAGDHNRVIAAVLDRRADAGAVYDGSLPYARAAGMATGELVVLAHTDPIPHDAITVRAGLDPALAGRIRDALVAINRSPAGRRVIAGSKKHLTGFAGVEDGVYDVVRRAAAIAAK